MIKAQIENNCRIIVNNKVKPFRQNDNVFKSASRALAALNHYHPAQDWLATVPTVSEPPPCPLTMSWTIDPDWLIDLGAGREAMVSYSESIFWAHMRGAVRRIQRPGCKHDTVMILVGAQGIGKSTFVRYLCPNPNWFLDGLDLSHPSTYTIRAIQGRLMAEVADVAFGRADASRQKGFITQSHDYLDKKYENERRVPRTCIFAFTTNDTEHLASDTTGGRRYNIVHLGAPLLDRNAIKKYLIDNILQVYGYAKYQVEQCGMDGQIPDEHEDIHDAAYAEAMVTDCNAEERIRIVVRKLVAEQTAPHAEQRIYSTDFIKTYGLQWPGNAKLYNNLVSPIFAECGYRRKGRDRYRGRYWAID